MKHRNFLIAALFIFGLSACKKNPDQPAPPIVPSGNPQNVTTFAGSSLRTAGFTNGDLTTATFRDPRGLAMDASGSLYLADMGNHAIRKITADGTVTTLAGSGTPGFANGNGTAASFDYPRAIAVDVAGNVFVADFNNHCIRKITRAGAVTTFAGSGVAGSTNAMGTTATFSYPSGIAIDKDGNCYIADSGNNLIRKITSGGDVTTFAGSGTAANTNGTGTAASFNEPFGIVITHDGDLIVTDRSNHSIRKITQAAVVTTLAGAGYPDFADGTGTAAIFSNPYYMTVDPYGNLYVTDWGNNRIRRITSTGVVTTLAGGTIGFVDDIGTSAKFNSPTGIVADSKGNLYVSDGNNNVIRKISY